MRRCASRQGDAAVRWFSLLVTLVCVFLCTTNTASAETDPQPSSLSYLDSQPLTLTLTTNDDARLFVAVRNTGADAANAEFCVLLQNEVGQDCLGLARVVGSNATIASRQVKVLSIQISGIRPPVSGFLGLITRDSNGKFVTTSFRSLKIGPSLLPHIAGYPIGIGLALSLVVCVYSGLRLASIEIPMLTRMGSPAWDFSKSWASNITVAGAFLSAALAIGALPEQTRYIARGGYGILNVFLTILLGVAPLVFNLIRKPIINENSPNGPQLEFQGYVITFLLACGLTLLAALGQIITLIILVNEFLPTALLSVITVRIFQWMLIFLMIGTIWYAGKTILWTAKWQKLQHEQALTKLSKAKAVPIDDVRNSQTPLSSWPLP